MSDKISNKFLFWSIIIVICFGASLSSLIRIYNIKEIFLSQEVRKDALLAMGYLKQERGYGATDTELERVVKKNEANVFYFEYYYHSPRIIPEKNEFAVSVDNGVIKIEEL
jgi:hypothetical protein